MALSVRDLRVSFVWSATVADLLLEMAPQSPRAFLALSTSYRSRFDEVRDPASTDALGPPWPRGAATHQPARRFWALLTTGDDRREVTANRAWEHVLPLHERLEVRLASGAVPVRVVAHGLSYPHGVGVVLQLAARGPLTQNAAREWARAVRHAPLGVQRTDGTVGQVGVDELGTALLDQMRTKLLGRASSADLEPALCTVATVVDAGGVTRKLTEPQHVTAQGLATWPPDWDAVRRVPLEHLVVPLPAANFTADDLLLARPRGRAVWCPTHLGTRAGPSTTLSSLHTELTWLALHVQSLCELLRSLDPHDDTELSPAQFRFRRLAVQLLGRLYGAGRSTYQSPSVRRQMDDCEYTAVVDRARAREGLPPLTV